MLFGHRAAALAVRLFSSGENALAKTRRAFQHFSYARNFDNVYANGDNHNG